VSRSSPGASVAIGVFDGVHRGHQQLIQEMVAASKAEGLASVCLTFDPDPEAFLNPGNGDQALISLPDRVARLEALGVSRVDVLPFTHQTAQQSAEDFIDWVQRSYGLQMLWSSQDFALGKGRSGTVDALAEMSEARHFSMRVVEPLRVNGRVVSSTWVREALRAGDVVLAADLLGRPFATNGPVVAGSRRGRELGFPTANMIPPRGRVLPAHGVYFVEADLAGRVLPAVASLGPRATFDENEPLLETYILDFDEPLYGMELGVAFLARLRDLVRFDTVEALKVAIQGDVDQARKLGAELSAARVSRAS
jgi:riboflavin kinase/FMN adenylyltransferase